MALDARRLGRITASRVGAVIGANRYQSRDDVMAEMLAQARGEPPSFMGNEATAWGNEQEPRAIAAYEAERAVMTWGAQVFVIHPNYDFLACSPDGLVGLDGMIEAKSPWTATYTHYSRKPEYRAQMNLQMECAGRDWCDFLVWRAKPRWSRDELFISRLERDPKWLDKHLDTFQAFMDEFAERLENGT